MVLQGLVCGSPVTPRSGVTGTARPTFRLPYREPALGLREGCFGTGGGQETGDRNSGSVDGGDGVARW